jgi:hypothetical protein
MDHAQKPENAWFWPYVLVALVAFVIGVALGQLGAVREPGPSRVDWPAPTTPHPRSLQP